MKIKHYGFSKGSVFSSLELYHVDNIVKKVIVYNNYLGQGSIDSLIEKTLEDAHLDILNRGFIQSNDQ